MKTAKRVLAVIIAVMMIVGTCAVAASAEGGSLQAQIDRGVNPVVLQGNTTESITIRNKEVTIDLNGFQLTSEPGSSAIKIYGGDVTVTNGIIESMYANVSSMQMIQEVNDKCPSSIWMDGGNLTVNGVRILGGKVRIPTTTEYFPVGSAIMTYNDATVTLKNSSLYGDYGVNNKVRVGGEGGVVTIEDAVILALNKAVSGQYAVANGSQEIIAADHIVGILNGKSFTEKQQEIVNNVLNERTLIVVKTPDTLITEQELDYPLITKTRGADYAEVTGLQTLNHLWDNTKGTDCSYRWVPEGVILMNDTVAPFDKVDASLVCDDTQIKYRIEYKMSDEAKPYILSLTKEGEENPLDGCLAWAGLTLDENYGYAYSTLSTEKLDSYVEVIQTLGDVLYKVDVLGSTTLYEDTNISDLDMYKSLRQKLYNIAGIVCYNAAERSVEFDGVTYNNIFGTDMPAAGFQGTMDRIEALRVGLEETIGGSFTNTNKWDELALWLVNTAYPELVDPTNQNNIFKTLVAQLHDLQGLLNGTQTETIGEGEYAQQINIGDVLEKLGLSQYVAQVNEFVSLVDMADAAINKLFNNNDVKSTIDYVKANATDLASYVSTAVYVINNWRDYFTPSKFIVDDTYVKGFSMPGYAEYREIDSEGKLHITVTGNGTVAFGNGTAFTGSTYDEINVDFNGTFTLTAVEDDDEYEFLFWVNKEAGSDRILSTEKTFTMNTNSSRDIEAVFNEIAKPVVYFTNPTGAISGKTSSFDTNGNAKIQNVKDPYVTGYTFTGWPNSSSELVYASSFDAAQNADLTNYFGGSTSVFANPNAYYKQGGATMLVRPTSTSFIITPTFTIPEGFTIKFIDNGETYEATGKLTQIAEMTSTLEGDAYWVDKNANDQIVCVNKTFPYTITDNATFESREGACPVDTVMRTNVTRSGDRIIFNVERSTKKNFVATGVVFSYTNSTPTLDGENCSKGTAKFTTKTGTYSPSFSATNLSTKTVYVRPYMEFASGEPFYGKTVTVINGNVVNDVNNG